MQALEVVVELEVGDRQAKKPVLDGAAPVDRFVRAKPEIVSVWNVPTENDQLLNSQPITLRLPQFTDQSTIDEIQQI